MYHKLDEQHPSWEANRSSAGQESPRFYETQRFIVTFTRARHLSQSRSTWIHSISHSNSWRSILILSYLLLLVLSRRLIQLSPPKPRMHLSSPHTCYMPRPSRYYLLISRIIFGEKCLSQTCSLCGHIHCPVTSSLLGQNIFRSTLLPNTRN